MMRKTRKLVLFLGMLLAFVITTRTGIVVLAAEEGTPVPTESTTPIAPTATPIEPTATPTVEPNYDDICSQIQLESAVNIAAGSQYQLILNNVMLEQGSYSLQWSSSNPAVATVTETDGVVTAMSVGTTTISCTLTINNQLYYYYSNVTVTDPKFSQDVFYVRTGVKTTLPVVGTSTRNYTYISSNNKILNPTTNGTSITGLTKGEVYVTALVDGRYISCKVIVSNVKINYSNVFLVTGKKATLKVSGQSGTTPIYYTSGNTKIATVTSKGVIKAVKTGSTTISISVDGHVYTCYVAVGKSTIIASLNRAYKALGSIYSQPRRMKKGYYDCSSLVWRTYSPSGYKFGNKSYAPTAAAQAKWLVTKKKSVATKGLDASKLRPGDLLYMKGSPNGRYKNISHVAIYIGNGRILHAKGTRYGVCIDNYSSYKSRVVVIGRF